MVLAYDDTVFRVKMTVDTAPSVNNQAIAFCIALEDVFEEVTEDIRGVQCGAASTGESDTSITEFRTYWFPISIVESIKN